MVVFMVTKEMIKSEIDRVQNEYLEPLYKIIKAFEESDRQKDQSLTEKADDNNLAWRKFINATYGCLFDAPIERGNQGDYEIRENIE
jgi:hypothetical protein